MLPQPTFAASPRLVVPYQPTPVRSHTHAVQHRPSASQQLRVVSAPGYAYAMPTGPHIIRYPQRRSHPNVLAPTAHMPQRMPTSSMHHAAQHCTQAARTENIKLYVILALFLVWVLAWIAVVFFYVQDGL